MIGAVELLGSYLERIERLNGRVNALVEFDLENAQERARHADRVRTSGGRLGPLHGLPISVKEMFDVAGMRTTWGNPDLADRRPDRNAVAIDRLIDAGAIVFGKSNIPQNMADWETHNPVYGETRNPWNLERSAGGSSGGAAAAVAAGLTGAEIGHEWGGSLRQPCHYCGVYGLNPTWAIVPNEGTSRFGDLREGEFAVAGPITRDARDLGLLLSVMAGPDGEAAEGWRLSLPEARHENLGSFRVAVMLDHPACPIDSDYRDALQGIVDRLAAQGVKVSGKARPEIDFDRVMDLFTRLVRAATSAYLPEARYREIAALVASEDCRAHTLLNARSTTASHRDWLAAHEAQLAMRRAWYRFFRDWDVMLCPAAATAATPFDGSGNVAERTICVNGESVLIEAQHFWFAHACLGSLPAVIAPIGTLGNGLPVGIQILGPRFHDMTAIRFAERLAEICGGYEPPGGASLRDTTDARAPSIRPSASQP